MPGRDPSKLQGNIINDAKAATLQSHAEDLRQRMMAMFGMDPSKPLGMPDQSMINRMASMRGPEQIPPMPQPPMNMPMPADQPIRMPEPTSGPPSMGQAAGPEMPGFQAPSMEDLQIFKRMFPGMGR